MWKGQKPFRKPVHMPWAGLVFWHVTASGNWLYCSIFLTKLLCSSLRGEHYTSTLSAKRELTIIRSVFPNPALIGINYIFLFNSVLRLSAIPAYCLGSVTDGQTHQVCRSLCLSLKKAGPTGAVFQGSGFSPGPGLLDTCSLTSFFASS